MNIQTIFLVLERSNDAIEQSKRKIAWSGQVNVNPQAQGSQNHSLFVFTKKNGGSWRSVLGLQSHKEEESSSAGV